MSDAVPSPRVRRSILDAQDIGEWLAGPYALGRVCRSVLLRSLVNDVYHIRATKGDFIVKVYRRYWRSLAEIRWEADLLFYLTARSVPVACPVARTDGETVTKIDAPEGTRYAVVFERVEGVRPERPFTDELYASLGGALGLIHLMAGDFACEHRRRPVDLQALIDEPLGRLQPIMRSVDRVTSERLLSAGAELRQELQALARRGLTSSISHHDVTLDNVITRRDGTVVLLDFDSGGPGWTALDLQAVYRHGTAGESGHWAAFLSGYLTHASLSAVDCEAIPYFVLAAQLWAWSMAGLRCEAWGLQHFDWSEIGHCLEPGGWWEQWREKLDER